LSRAGGRRLQVVIDVSPFDHLREINGHSIKELSGLRIRIHLLVSKDRDSRGAVKELREKQNQQHEHAHTDQEFDQRKSAFARGYGATGSAEALTLLRQRKAPNAFGATLLDCGAVSLVGCSVRCPQRIRFRHGEKSAVDICLRQGSGGRGGLYSSAFVLTHVH